MKGNVENGRQVSLKLRLTSQLAFPGCRSGFAKEGQSIVLLTSYHVRSGMATSETPPGRTRQCAGLPVERRVLARLGWVGKNRGHIEHALQPFTICSGLGQKGGG